MEGIILGEFFLPAFSGFSMIALAHNDFFLSERAKSLKMRYNSANFRETRKGFVFLLQLLLHLL